MGYLSIEAEPDIWFKWAVKPQGEGYYKYMCVYFYNILHLAHYPKEDMDALNFTYRLNEESAGPYNRCLGSNVDKVHMYKGKEFW